MERLTERTLYLHIISELERAAREVGVEVSCEEGLGYTGSISQDVFPDIVCRFNGERLLIQVKIGRKSELLEDLVKIYPLAKQLNASLALLLYPEEVRSIPPSELGRVFSVAKLPEAHVASDFLALSLRSVTTYDIAHQLFSAYKEFQVSRIPAVDYSTIATICRESIVKLSTAVRDLQRTREYKDMAQAIVGRFDFYKSMLSEMVEKEEVMETYIADIAGYLAVIYLLLSHVFSVKLFGRSILPPIDNPLSPPSDYISLLLDETLRVRLHEGHPVLRAAPDILGYFVMLSEKSKGINDHIARLSYGLQVLRPEHVREELFGRIFQEGLPPETRKNLGAFFTKPKAAMLLARLSVDSWDEKVLDPACGSGTLLVAAYKEKERLAKTSPTAPREAEALHRQLIEQVTGIDIMAFAREIASANLAATHIGIMARPNIYWGDGILKMHEAVQRGDDDPSEQELILRYLQEMEGEYKTLALQKEGYDLVIMNPPFTAWKRIPDKERTALRQLYGGVVKGDVGYWAYFFIAADNVIRPNGKLAAVTPEEFFAGESAGSLRTIMLLGNPDRRYVYVPIMIVKSAGEVAFSEGTLYRDYLAVFRKALREEVGGYPMILAILKKRLDDMNEKEIEEVLRRIETSITRDLEIIEDDLVLIRRVADPRSYIERCSKNLKPLVAFYTGLSQRVLRRLIEDLLSLPKLSDVTELSYYRPGPKDAEEYARGLFIARYLGRGKTIFRITEDSGDRLTAQVIPKVRKRRAERRRIEAFTIVLSKSHLRPSLRSPAGVSTLSLGDKPEWVIIDEDALSLGDWRRAGFINHELLMRALEDVRRAYEERATSLLVGRRLQLTSPNIFWLAFYSPEPALTTEVLVNYRLSQKIESSLGSLGYKALTLYLNSSCALASILAYYIETRGAWGDLHPGLVWNEIPVPNLASLDKRVLEEVCSAFDGIAGAPQERSLLRRLVEGDPIQRRIDELSMKMLGLGDRIREIDAIREAVAAELKVLDEILAVSSKAEKRRGRRRKSGEEDTYQRSLTEYL
jgi:predicted RNA methylase